MKHFEKFCWKCSILIGSPIVVYLIIRLWARDGMIVD